MKQFDYIIAGAGMAGLTLAYMLMGSKDKKKTVLILDRDDKSKNDRTWSFWEKSDNLFENLVYKSWDQARFSGPGFDSTFDITPYKYKMIRGSDFYAFMKAVFSKSDQITWFKEEILNIEDNGIVKTNLNQYQAKYVFDSTFDYKSLLSKDCTTLLQHFKGYVIETEQPCFNPDQFTYMDFNVDQEGDCRFGYVLPFTPKKALIEYTLFNDKVLSPAEYDKRLNDYIKTLQIPRHKILEEEYGIIPMTDFPFQQKQSDQVIRIGTNGGFTKASTGFTFLRSQKILKKVVENLDTNDPPLKNLPYQKSRFKKYDATLLNVLHSGKYTGDQLFTPMFKKNGAKAFFKFLDEETSLGEELKIMSSTPILNFATAFIKSMLK